MSCPARRPGLGSRSARPGRIRSRGRADADFEQLMVVNALAPMALLGAAAKCIGAGGALTAITAVLVDRPIAGMGAYSAKSALAAWLTSLRGEFRRDRIAVLGIRAPHMDSGLMGRALMGEPFAALPPPFDRHVFENAVVRSLEQGTKVLRFDPHSGEPVPTEKTQLSGAL